ncbi:MAG: Lrp/AsnC family transcriptional regulator [Lachnospiraceae bacterium]|nr:Lrp/AsnC family transcriptional regulator [Lachnospiraceae bacterium]
MNELLKLLSDGKSRTLEMLALELNTSVENVKRDIDFLERTGMIKRILFTGAGNEGHSCNGCTGCGTGKKTCEGCMPKDGFQNMGVMWEVCK